MLCVSVWVVLVPVIAAQYALAIIGLIALARREMRKGPYIVWNIVILLVFFAGSIAFLVYDRVCPRSEQRTDKSDADGTTEGEQSDD